MNRNGWILVCAAVLLGGLWMAWSSISGVEAAGSTPGALHVAGAEEEPLALASCELPERHSDKEPGENRRTANPVHVYEAVHEARQAGSPALALV